MEHPKNATEQAVDRMEKPVELLSHLPSLGEAAQVSMAISLKRIADAMEAIRTHHAPPAGQEVGGFSQAENNASDLLSDRLHDLAQNIGNKQ